MTDSLGQAVPKSFHLRLLPIALTCFTAFLRLLLFAFFGIFDRCAHLCVWLIGDDSSYRGYRRNVSLQRSFDVLYHNKCSRLPKV